MKVFVHILSFKIWIIYQEDVYEGEEWEYIPRGVQGRADDEKAVSFMGTESKLDI